MSGISRIGYSTQSENVIRKRKLGHNMGKKKFQYPLNVRKALKKYGIIWEFLEVIPLNKLISKLFGRKLMTVMTRTSVWWTR